LTHPFRPTRRRTRNSLSQYLFLCERGLPFNEGGQVVENWGRQVDVYLLYVGNFSCWGLVVPGHGSHALAYRGAVCPLFKPRRLVMCTSGFCFFSVTAHFVILNPAVRDEESWFGLDKILRFAQNDYTN
jgi:hypothetical protein